MTRFWKSFLVICVLAAGSGFYWWKSQPATKNAGAVPGKAAKADAKGAGKGGGVLPVKAVGAVMKPMPVLVEAVGTVEPEHSVQVRAQVSGVLKSVLFKEGDRVKAGQLLFQIDPRTFQSQYDQALAAMARDQALLENAGAVTSAKSLEATVAADRAIAEQARIQLEYSRITAPIAGRTGTLAVTPGNLVPAAGGGGPLVTINSMDPILAAFSIPERQLKEIRRYQNSRDMRIEILPDRGGSPVAEGKLVFIDNTVTPQTGTVLLKTRVANTKELIWPGQFVNVRIVLTVEPEAVVVPEGAVQPGREGRFVYLIDAGKK